jgi:hypothetical protein
MWQLQHGCSTFRAIVYPALALPRRFPQDFCHDKISDSEISYSSTQVSLQGPMVVRLIQVHTALRRE